MAQSTLPLTIAGTLAVHLIIAVTVDVFSVVGRSPPRPPKQTLTLVDIDVKAIPPPPPEAPPPPEIAPPVVPPTTPPPTTPPPQRTTRAPRTPTAEPPPPGAPPPPSDAPVTPNAGGGPVVKLDGIAPAARGVPVASGRPTGERLGRGGRGGGTGDGTGAGSGSGAAPPVPTSIASIKTPAEAKDGFDYFDARKAYPAEARRLGIEGKIRVRLLVDASGKVSQARLLGALGHGLDELALARARAIQFHPARDSDDRPVASVVIWTFTFTLPSDT